MEKRPLSFEKHTAVHRSILNVRSIFDHLPERNIRKAFWNLKANWFFPISALAFFCLNAYTYDIVYFVNIGIAFVISIVFASQMPPIIKWIKSQPIPLAVFSALSAGGMCWCAQIQFDHRWRATSNDLRRMLYFRFHISVHFSRIISIIGAILSFFFVFCVLLLILKKLRQLMVETQLLRDITTTEKVVYVLLAAFVIMYVVAAFTKSQVFYATKYSDNLIFTSDSPTIVQAPAYLSLTQPENDIRQPLFAVFAAPFIGLPYLIGKFFELSSSLHAILLNSVQVLMLLFANFVLSKMMKLPPTHRICFMLVTSATYTQLLFTLMMEQYIVAYFWLMICLYSMLTHSNVHFALYGAGSTLLTSIILLPIAATPDLEKPSLKAWFWATLKGGVGFVHGNQLCFSSSNKHQKVI